ncbi:MAG TPA: DUF1080 domain-containing protein [Candidatus Acidoferrum sp.]|jgi:hypothetical protein|nr:DUF1080 domain-containing protein [Candidatus Acidoferrum sp.]
MSDHLSRLSPGVSLLAALLLSLPTARAFATEQAPAASGDEQFNGRWDIKTAGERARAWWLEIENAGTAEPKGKFISAFGGDLNVIEEISIHDGILRFGWTRQQRSSADAAPTTRKLVYTAKLVNGKLQGTFEVEGSNQPPLEWTGVRAPEIKEADDGSWREGKSIELFNGKDMSGWRSWDGGEPVGWSVKDAALASTGKGQDLVSEQKFWNFKLHVEFRLAEHSNSGVALRNRYEVQMLEDYGRPPNTHSAGALYSRIAPSENASKPAGEWQTYDIRLVGRQVTVVFNGKKVIDKGTIEGLTAMAHNADEGEPGGIALQGDHGPVDFRKITITPLVK